MLPNSSVGFSREKTGTSPFFNLILQLFSLTSHPSISFLIRKGESFLLQFECFKTPLSIFVKAMGIAWKITQESAHDRSLFLLLSTGEIPQEKPAWDRL